jgi:hypothetical protein
MSAVMTEPIASKQLAKELWISLASLLRSHVAMHSIAQPDGQLRIIATSDSAVEVLGSYGKLSALGPDELGRGSTEFRPEAGELGDEYSTFFFTADGLIQLEDSDVPMDTESVVEHWLRKVQA